MNTVTAKARRTERHIAVNDMLAEMALLTLEGVGVFQIATRITEQFADAPHHKTVQVMCRAIRPADMDAAKQLRFPSRRLLLRAARQGMSIYQAALDLGVSVCEVILAISHQSDIEISHREHLIVHVPDGVHPDGRQP